MNLARVTGGVTNASCRHDSMRKFKLHSHLKHTTALHASRSSSEVTSRQSRSRLSSTSRRRSSSLAPFKSLLMATISLSGGSKRAQGYLRAREARSRHLRCWGQKLSQIYLTSLQLETGCCSRIGEINKSTDTFTFMTSSYV